MNVKMLVNQIFWEKLKSKDEKKRFELANPERYLTFKKTFGDKEFGFILAGDLMKGIETKKEIPAYGLDNKLNPYLIEEGINSKLFLPSSFSTKNDGFSSRKEIEKMMNYLELEKTKGNIEKIVNGKKAVLFEDKLSVLELQTKGFKTPKTFYFEKYDDFKNFIKEKDSEYIIKHRFGQEGIGLEKVSSKNIENFTNKEIENYVVQEKLETTNEKRLIFYGDNLIAARIIKDRQNPWEKGVKSNRNPETHKYNPSKEEIKDSLEILQYSGTEIGCVDWVETKNDGAYYMEINGFGTGYGREPIPYNVNKLIADNLKRDFL